MEHFEKIGNHPRACGELILRYDHRSRQFGSSPRMRGTPPETAAHRIGHRIIPAHAGNSYAQVERRTDHADHPRACGELSDLIQVSDAGYGSSPRMRGTPPASR